MVLCEPDGALLGSLAPIDLESRWLPGCADLVEAVRARDGLQVTVLRLLGADRSLGKAGAQATYLGELTGSRPKGLRLGPVPTLPEHALAEQVNRAAFAHPGGPRAELTWAAEELERLGTLVTGDPTQVRTWNLSAIWRLPTATGPVWLKSVPPFFAHEGAVLDLVRHVSGRGAPVPPLLAYDPGHGRVLLGEVGGRDLHDAGLADRLRMVRLLVQMQVALVDHVDELVGTGAFDWRPGRFDALAADVVDRTAEQLERSDRATLDRLVAGLSGRHEAVAACGLPDTLVHGDFHPGNVRGGPGSDGLVVLDWGDSGVGNPLLDCAAMVEDLTNRDRQVLLAEWCLQWRKTVPDCDPATALKFSAPVAALRLAVLYRLFLDQIEPSERPYHAADPARWLAVAASLV